MLYSHWLLLMYLLYSFTTCTMTKRVLDHRRVHNQQRSHGRHHHRRKTSASPVTRLDELLRGPSVSYVQHQSLNPKQLETQKSLKNELKKLERRTRWVPPVPCLNCRSGYSLYSSPRNYGPNQVLYLQRLVQKLNSDVGRLHTSVDSLIRWKSSAEHNVQRLEEQIETMNEQLSDHNHSDRTNIGSQSTATNNNFDQSRQVQALQTMVIELQSSVRSLQQQQLQQAHIPDSGSNTNHVVAVNSNNDEGTPASVDTGVNDLLNLHGRRLNSHDNVLRKTSIDITSLQHHLVSILSKNSKQDRQISFLRSVCSNTTTSVASIPHMVATENDGGIGPGQSRSIENLRRSYQTQEREINLLKRKVSESQSCCRDVVTLSRRLDSTVAHVEEARIRADESMAVIVLQDHKVNEVVGKLDRQRVVIQRLQESVRNQQHSLSVMNRNIRDSLNRRTQRINETLFANITAFMTSFENRVHNRWSAMSTQLERNNNTLQTVGQYLDQVSQQTSENSQYIEELETKLLEHVNQAGNNVTLVAQRLNMNERTLIGMMSRLDEIGNLAKVQRKAVEIRIKNAETKILLLEDNLTHLGDSPDLSSSVEESVVFLNSSFHRLRSALHRLSNRVDGVNTAVHKHSATDRRTKNRFSRIHSLIKEQNERSNNESMLLRRRINSDADSLRHTVALRLSLLSSHISNITSSVTDIASQRDTLYDHIMSVEQSLNLSLNRLQRNTDHIQVNLDLNHERMKTNDSDLRRKIYLLNETMNELVAQSQNGLHENLMEITNILNTRVTSVHRNFTNLSSNLEAVQRSLGDAETNINNVTNHYHDMRNHMNIVKGNVEELMTSQHDLQTRLRTVDQTVHNQMINISLNQENINLNKQLALNLHSVCQEERNATRQFEKSVQEQFKQIGENVARNQLTINSRLTTVSNKVVEVKTSLHDVTSLHNTRLMSLESLNGSWIPLFGNCNNNLALVRDDIRALQRTDGNFQVSLELHERALIEHRRLHTNLSAISEDVSSVINEHEVALHSVKGVVLQLNETLVEGEERIGEEIEAQLKRHMREVVGLRGIMRNFTSIVQTMISNRLDQEISIASVRMHQRGLVETVDSHTASLDRLNHDNIQIKSEIAGVGADTENNLRKITNLIRISDSHDRNIERLDSSVFYLNDVTARLNTSLVGHVRNLESVEHRTSSYRTVISDLVEQQTTHENEFDRFKHTITGTVNRIHDHHQQYWDQIERNNNSITRFETWIKSAEEWLQQLDENADLVDTRFDLVIRSLEVLPILEHNVSALTLSLGETIYTCDRNYQNLMDFQNDLENIETSLSQLKSKSYSQKIQNDNTHNRILGRISTLQQTSEATSTAVTESSNSIRELGSTLQTFKLNTQDQIESFEHRLDTQSLIVESSIAQLQEEKRKNDAILVKLETHGDAFTLFNLTLDKWKTTLDSLTSSSSQHSQTIRRILRNNAENTELLQLFQTNSWNAASRLNELSTRTDSVEDQVSYLEGKVRGSRVLSGQNQEEIDDLQRYVQILVANVSETLVETQKLSTLQHALQNTTDRLSSNLERQTYTLQTLNQSVSFSMNSQLLASIISSVSALEDTVRDVNDTLSEEIMTMDDLLTDFQLAFDTSGRRLEKHGHELRILTANTSNYFSFVSSTIDVLRMIVSETNEAVVENNERIRLINESLLQLAFSQYVVTVPPPRDNITMLPPRDLNLAPDEVEANGDGSQSVDAFYPDSVLARMSIPAGIQLKPAQEDSPHYEDYERSFFKDILSEMNTYENVPSHYNEYETDGEYDLSSILNGEADADRIERRRAALRDPSYVQIEEMYDDLDY